MLTAHRHSLGLTQAEYAQRLGVTQAYVSQLERGLRPLTPALEKRLAKCFAGSPTRLPLTLATRELDDDTLAHALGKLGYPAFAHLRQSPLRNPATVLLECLRKSNLDPRITAGLPWLLSRFRNLDKDWLLSTAKQHNLQNRLGFLVSLAHQHHPLPHLAALLAHLEPARLASEQTLMNDTLPTAMRTYLRANRTPLATHWNLLTTLDTDSPNATIEKNG